MAVFVIAAAVGCGPGPEREAEFSGERALRRVAEQMDFGPRYPGSRGHAALQGWIEAQLMEQGWGVERQTFEHQGIPLSNIIGGQEGLGDRMYLVGAHYDTRPVADEESGSDPPPVPGANDGASGVAVLLELARVLPRDRLNCDLRLVFFDAEDSGRLPGWDWTLGSSYYAAHMDVEPDAVVIVDMIGDADLQLPRERNSTPELVDELWSVGRELGYEAFLDRQGYSIIDDHTPFLRRGVPAVDIIDFDYPYWHTKEDTLDKVSANSLMAVGHTVETWLEAECGRTAPK